MFKWSSLTQLCVILGYYHNHLQSRPDNWKNMAYIDTVRDYRDIVVFNWDWEENAMFSWLTFQFNLIEYCKLEWYMAWCFLTKTNCMFIYYCKEKAKLYMWKVHNLIFHHIKIHILQLDIDL